MATIDDLDLSDNQFILSPMNLTDDIETLITNIVANIKYDKTTFEGANAETQGKVNEIINELNNINAGVTTDVTNIQNMLDSVIALQSSTVNPSFISLFQTLFDAINDRQEVLIHKLNVTATTEGRVIVDLSAYNFKSIESYEIIPTVTTPDTRVSTSIVIKKLSATEAEVTIRDLGYIQSVNVPNSFYNPAATNKDGTVNGALDLMLEVVRVSVPLSAVVVDALGDEYQIGSATVPSVIIDSIVTDVTSGIVTITGQQGTEAGTTLSLINADTTVVFSINATDGTNEFTVVSNSAVLRDWDKMKIRKVIGTDQAFDVLVPYESIYPQITSDMLVVADDGTITFTGNLELANGTLKIIIDEGEATEVTLADVTLDSDGIGTTTEQSALLKDGATHYVKFTVTVDSLESLPETNEITIAIDGSNNEL